MRKPLSYIEMLRKLSHAGMSHSPEVNRAVGTLDDLPTLRERVNFLLGVVNNPMRPITHMLFFVMYDIASNKVRYLVAKYLERKGCTRVQRSIF